MIPVTHAIAGASQPMLLTYDMYDLVGASAFRHDHEQELQDFMRMPSSEWSPYPLNFKYTPL